MERGGGEIKNKTFFPGTSHWKCSHSLSLELLFLGSKIRKKEEEKNTKFVDVFLCLL